MTRAAAKAKSDRHCAEDFDPGDRLVWSERPIVRNGEELVPAPSVLGTVSWSTGGTAFVRFFIGGRLGEPREVSPGQLCERQEDL